MALLQKTTIVLPQDLLFEAKHTAIEEHTTLSQLIAEGLMARIRTEERKKRPVHVLGIYQKGIKTLYKKRTDLYDSRLKKALSY